MHEFELTVVFTDIKNAEMILVEQKTYHCTSMDILRQRLQRDFLEKKRSHLCLNLNVVRYCVDRKRNGSTVRDVTSTECNADMLPGIEMFFRSLMPL